MRVSADGPVVQKGGYYQKSQVDPSETCCQASFKFKGLEGCSISFRSLWALSYSSGVACRAWLQCIQGPIPSTSVKLSPSDVLAFSPDILNLHAVLFPVS